MTWSFKQMVLFTPKFGQTKQMYMDSYPLFGCTGIPPYPRISFSKHRKVKWPTDMGNHLPTHYLSLLPKGLQSLTEATDVNPWPPSGSEERLKLGGAEHPLPPEGIGDTSPMICWSRGLPVLWSMFSFCATHSTIPCIRSKSHWVLQNVSPGTSV